MASSSSEDAAKGSFSLDAGGVRWCKRLVVEAGFLDWFHQIARLNSEFLEWDLRQR